MNEHAVTVIPQTPEEIASSFLTQPTTGKALAFGGEVATELKEKVTGLVSLSERFNDVLRTHNDALNAMIDLDLDAAEAGYQTVRKDGEALLVDMKAAFNSHCTVFDRAGATIAAGTLIQKKVGAGNDFLQAFKQGSFADLGAAINKGISQGYQSQRQIEKLGEIITHAKKMPEHLKNLRSTM